VAPKQRGERREGPRDFRGGQLKGREDKIGAGEEIQKLNLRHHWLKKTISVRATLNRGKGKSRLGPEWDG